MATCKLNLRPITDDDLPFLNQLYHTTRDYEMERVVDWSEEQKAAFLTMQFEAQHKHYQIYYADADFDIIELSGKAIGRLYLERRKDEFRIVDIALMPKYRRLGIGSHYLHSIMDEAAEHELPVRIHVEHDNPAMRLYLRLGFTQIDTNGVYHLMEWLPKQ
jgi:ribosomal protein S18 acetylase RimI-like enzyme